MAAVGDATPVCFDREMRPPRHDGVLLDTVRLYAIDWLARHRAVISAASHYAYTYNLTRYVFPALGHEPLCTLTRAIIRTGLDRSTLERGLSTATWHAARTPLAAMLEDAVQRGVLEHNPARGLRQRERTVRKKIAYGAGELGKFLDTTAELRPDLLPLFAACAYAGLRIGEALALRSEDIDLAKKVVTIVRTIGPRTRKIGPPKGRRPRVLPLAKTALAIFARRLADARQGWLFPGRSGVLPLDYTVVRRQAVRIAERAGIPPNATHVFRRTFAVHTGQRVGGDALRQLLGHASLQTTDRYVRDLLPVARPPHFDEW